MLGSGLSVSLGSCPWCQAGRGKVVSWVCGHFHPLVYQVSPTGPRRGGGIKAKGSECLSRRAAGWSRKKKKEQPTRWNNQLTGSFRRDVFPEL